MIDLSIIIVNWNVCDLLRRCLESLLAGAQPDADAPDLWLSPDSPSFRFEIIVVDSASSDGSVYMVQSEFPRVILHASPTNLGYAGGNNWGLEHARGRYVLILNPDTWLPPGTLPLMLRYLDEHPQVGVVGPQLCYPDGSIQSSRRRFPTLTVALVESTFLQKWFPRHPALRRYYTLDLPDQATGEVDWLSGACLMARREVIAQVGLFDEAFFMYSEELDWQKRIRAAGWHIVYLPTARVIHYEGKSSEQVIALRHIRFQKSKIRYMTKHHGRWIGRLVRAWLLFNYVYEWTVEALKWLAGHKRPLRRERMQVYAQVLRTGLRL